VALATLAHPILGGLARDACNVITFTEARLWLWILQAPIKRHMRIAGLGESVRMNLPSRSRHHVTRLAGTNGRMRSRLILPWIEFADARHRHRKRPQRVQHAHGAGMFVKSGAARLIGKYFRARCHPTDMLAAIGKSDHVQN
jgi:hypothetical protein